MSETHKNFLSRMKEWIMSFFPSYITRLRYDAAVEAAERELNALTKDELENNPNYKAAKDALEKAKTKKKDISYSWCYIHEAQVYTLLVMPEAERKARTQALQVEIKDKLTLWRKKQAEVLLDMPKDSKLAPPPENVAEALRIRNDYFDTQFTRLAYRRRNLNVIGGWLIALLIAVFITLCKSNLCSDTCNIWGKALIALEFGSLGACLSMAYTLTSAPVNTKIPEHLMSGFIVLVRMGIGATCAVVSLMLLESDMLSNIINSEIKNESFGYIVIAFIAGFSERWFMGVIDKVSGDSKNKEK